MDNLALNADFTRRASVHGGSMPWQASPMPGVDRRMLDRIGGEVARATSIVRYAPGSHFSPHVHTGGEEFLVLDGVFQDEHGDFPKGTYVRNPPGSSHTPGSEPGCTIFVKLWQFDPADRQTLRKEIAESAFEADDTQAGVHSMPLYTDDRETVRVEKWAPGTEVVRDAKGGAELFVISGGFSESGENFTHQSWLRIPVASQLRLTTGADGCTCWIKEGHLAHLESEAFAVR